LVLVVLEVLLKVQREIMEQEVEIVFLMMEVQIQFLPLVVAVVGVVEHLQTLSELVVQVVEQDTLLPLVAVAHTQDLQEQQIRDMPVETQLTHLLVVPVVEVVLVELETIAQHLIKVVLVVMVKHLCLLTVQELQ
tara:strand:- start:13 stop:417 length:405 start_codon:yes stop_codon:yes gene_type:complete